MTITCGKCGNDGIVSPLYVTVDVKWDGERWVMEKRTDDSPSDELDCLMCDTRTAIEIENYFPFGVLPVDDVERRELYIEFDGDTPVAAVYRENRREVMRCSIRCAALAAISPTAEDAEKRELVKARWHWLLESKEAEAIVPSRKSRLSLINGMVRAENEMKQALASIGERS